jgi:hypothetical protein
MAPPPAAGALPPPPAIATTAAGKDKDKLRVALGRLVQRDEFLTLLVEELQAVGLMQ